MKSFIFLLIVLILSVIAQNPINQRPIASVNEAEIVINNEEEVDSSINKVGQPEVS